MAVEKIVKKEFTKSLSFGLFWLKLSGITLDLLDTSTAFNWFRANYLFMFNTIWLYTGVGGEFIYIWHELREGTADIIELSPICPCVAISVMSTGKAICLYLNQGTLKSVLDTFEDLYPVMEYTDEIDEDDRVTEEEKKVVNNTMKLIYTSIGVLGTFISMVVLSFILLPIVLILYIYFTTGNFEYKTPFLVYYFVEMESIPYWLFVYFHHVWCTKSIFLFLNQGVLKSIFDRLEEFHPSAEDESDVLNKEEVKLVNNSVKLIVLSINTLGLVASVIMMNFFMLPLAIMAHSYVTTGEFKYITPFLVKYFFDIDTAFNWAVVYIHHIWTTLVVCGNVYGADILILLFCCYIKMHFELIGKRFEGVINDDSLETTQKNIRKLIIRHQSILNLVEAMDVLFSKATLIQCVISSIMICFCLFTATFTDSTLNLITFALFLFMILVEMMMLCYFGDMLISASTEFGDDVYRCLWYNAHPSIMKDLIFILQRTQTPCKITALGFADLRLMTFTSILSSSWSYYALIRTMYE